MTRVDLAGIGIWCEQCSSWDQFRALVRGESVEAESKPPAALIDPRERRRAPLSVRMTVEVMDQACRVAGADPSSVATVFGSSMGDVQITDYMCRTVASEPRSLSPTKFHNSVHNASTGYWSIATGSHGPANAVSGGEHSPAVALLEGAIQAVEERVPVIVAFQEMASPPTFEPIFPARQPLAIALLLMPADACERPLGRISLEVEPLREPVGNPASAPGSALPPGPTFAPGLSGNFAASMLGLLIAAAADQCYVGCIPVSASSSLAIGLSRAQQAASAQPPPARRALNE